MLPVLQSKNLDPIWPGGSEVGNHVTDKFGLAYNMTFPTKRFGFNRHAIPSAISHGCPCAPGSDRSSHTKSVAQS